VEDGTRSITDRPIVRPALTPAPEPSREVNRCDLGDRGKINGIPLTQKGDLQIDDTLVNKFSAFIRQSSKISQNFRFSLKSESFLPS
jgi:hypothetical protein